MLLNIKNIPILKNKAFNWVPNLFEISGEKQKAQFRKSILYNAV